MSLDQLVEPSNITSGTLSTESGPIVMSNPPHPSSQLKTQTIEAENLDQLREIFTSTGLAIQSADAGRGAGPDVENIPGSAEELNEEHLSSLEQATRAYLNNGAELPDSIKELVSQIRGSITVQAYVAQDIVVTPTNPWIISGQGPVVIQVNKVTVQPGGQIQVLTDASITIAELIKQ